jgi:membrane associated rhomboid family serine protease
MSLRSTIGFKLREILLPFVSLSAGFVLIYSLLHWVIIAQAQSVVLNDKLVNLILPMVLPWFPILFSLRHRIRLLKWPSSDNDAFAGYVLAWLLMVAPATIVQIWLEDSAGSITRLNRISEFDAERPTRFYAVKQFEVDKRGAWHGVRTYVSGRHSEYWNEAVYYVAPLLDSLPTQPAGAPTAYIGVSYSRQRRNSMGQEFRRTSITDFMTQSAQKFAEDDFRWIAYFGLARDDEQRRGFELALRGDGSTRGFPPGPVLVPSAEPFDRRGGNKIAWAAGTFAGGVAVWLLAVLILGLDHGQVRRWRISGGKMPNDDLRSSVAFLMPRIGFAVTPAMLLLNSAVWIAMVCFGLAIDSASASDLMKWGALHGRALQDGEGWRLVTSLFVHANALHFFNNMFALVLTGIFVEQRFGPCWTGSAYLVSGLAGGLASIWWSQGFVLVGASGSIYGVAGFGLTLTMVNRQLRTGAGSGILKIATIYLGINLVVGAILPGVSLVAHLAGLGAGVLLGLVALPAMKENPWQLDR